MRRRRNRRAGDGTAGDQHGEDDGAARRRIVTLGSAEYPPPLLAIEDPPILLYMMGQPVGADALARAVAIVGSRNPTPQGEGNARAFAKSLAGIESLVKNARLALEAGDLLGLGRLLDQEPDQPK